MKKLLNLKVPATSRMASRSGWISSWRAIHWPSKCAHHLELRQFAQLLINFCLRKRNYSPSSWSSCLRRLSKRNTKVALLSIRRTVVSLSGRRPLRRKWSARHGWQSSLIRSIHDAVRSAWRWCFAAVECTFAIFRLPCVVNFQSAVKLFTTRLEQLQITACVYRVTQLGVFPFT